MFECGCCWHVCVCTVRSDVLLSNPESINQLSWMLRLIFSDSVIEWYKWSVRSIITYSVAPRYYTRSLACTQLQLSYRQYICETKPFLTWMHTPCVSTLRCPPCLRSVWTDWRRVTSGGSWFIEDAHLSGAGRRSEPRLLLPNIHQDRQCSSANV